MVLAEYNMLSRKSNACLIQATVLLVVPYETQEEDVAVSDYKFDYCIIE